MKSSTRELRVPLYASTARSLEIEALRLGTTIDEIATYILEKLRIAAAGKKFPREAQCAHRVTATSSSDKTKK